MMRFFKQLSNAKKAAAALALAVLVSAGSVKAAGVVNGGFETGDFTGWTTLGNTSVQDATFGSGPTGGTYDALVLAGPASGTTGINDAVPASQLDTFLGIPAGTLEGSSNQYFNGSAIQQTFSVHAGDTLTFKYNFLTNEDNSGAGFPDGGFVVGSGTAIGSVQPQLLADPTSATNSSLTGFGFETGFQSFSSTFANSGTFTLTFMTVNSMDGLNSSALLVDDVALTAANNGNGGNGGGGAVPLPASFYLFPLGLLAAGAYGLQIRRRAQA